jgi:hypothetical protein
MTTDFDFPEPYNLATSLVNLEYHRACLDIRGPQNSYSFNRHPQAEEPLSMP